MARARSTLGVLRTAGSRALLRCADAMVVAAQRLDPPVPAGGADDGPPAHWRELLAGRPVRLPGFACGTPLAEPAEIGSEIGAAVGPHTRGGPVAVERAGVERAGVRPAVWVGPAPSRVAARPGWEGGAARPASEGGAARPGSEGGAARRAPFRPAASAGSGVPTGATMPATLPGPAGADIARVPVRRGG